HQALRHDHLRGAHLDAGDRRHDQRPGRHPGRTHQPLRHRVWRSWRMMTRGPQLHRRLRGSALVAALWVIVALVGIVLVFSRWMTVEALASKQHVSSAKCDAAELGVEQFVLAAANAELKQPGYIDLLVCNQREIGDCYF